MSANRVEKQTTNPFPAIFLIWSDLLRFFLIRKLCTHWVHNWLGPILEKLSTSTTTFNVIYMLRCAEYMTELPKRELLEQKLHKAGELARKRLEVKPAECNTEYKWCQRDKMNRRIVYIYYFFLREIGIPSLELISYWRKGVFFIMLHCISRVQNSPEYS